MPNEFLWKQQERNLILVLVKIGFFSFGEIVCLAFFLHNLKLEEHVKAALAQITACQILIVAQGGSSGNVMANISISNPNMHHWGNLGEADQYGYNVR